MTDDRPSPIWRAVIYAGAALQGLWIGLPVTTKLMVCAMAADILTGLVRAAAQGRINSHCSWKGMCKKALMLIFTGWLLVVDQHLNDAVPLGAMASMAFFGTEGISVVENLIAMGVPVPEHIARVFRDAAKEPPKEGKK